MFHNEIRSFIQTEKNLSMDFVEQAKIHHPDGIYLYGAGQFMHFIVIFLRQHDVKIKAIIDTNRNGQYQDIPIIKLSDFLASAPDTDAWFVVSAPSVQEDIIDTLAPYFPLNNVFSFETSLYTGYIPSLEQYRCYLLEHLNEFEDFYDALADKKSKETLTAVIKGRVSGDVSYFRQCYDPIQYYTPEIIHFSAGEVMAELGANNGDTLLEFMQRCPDYKSVYCFEPGKTCHPILNQIANRSPRKECIHIIPNGAWDSHTTLKFVVENNVSEDAHVLMDENDAASYLIETVTVDEIVKEPITFMKMDIEGSEMRALHGAERQIVQNKPKLAICVYHRQEDFLDIWHYLRELVPEYRFYLRHHVMYAGADTVLYAVAGER